MIALTFRITYSREERAQTALATYRRDAPSIKAMIDRALNLRAKLIFDSQPFQSVPLETRMETPTVSGRTVRIVVRTNQKKLVRGYEAALNGTTLFFFDGVASILKREFSQDEFLLGDYITDVFIDVQGATEIREPLEQALSPIADPISDAAGSVWDAVKTPLTIAIVAISVVAVAYIAYKAYELYASKK